MLETEIKKLTVAIEALNQTMSRGSASEPTPTPSTEPAAPVNTPAPIPTPGPAPNDEWFYCPAPAGAIPAPAPVGAPTPAVAAPASQTTFEQVKSELSAIIQKMNDGGAAVSGLVGSFTTPQGQPARLLSEIDPVQFPQVLEAARKLVQ